MQLPGLILLLGALASPAAAEGWRAVDGDTIVSPLGERIRLDDIDAPELRDARCPRERKIAEASRDKLQGLVQRGYVTVERRGQDRYRRTLAIVRVGGINLGAELVRIGYAKPWSGRGQKPEWCS